MDCLHKTPVLIFKTLFPPCFVLFDRALILFNWCVLPRAKFNENCTISSKIIELPSVLSVLLSVVLFLKLSSVARITFYFIWFSKYSGNQFPNFSTYGGWGNECCILSFARFLMSSASNWAVRFRLPPPSLQTAPFSGPLNSFFVILNEWCVSA